MLDIRIDDDRIEELFKKELKKRLDEIQSQELFWDMKDLQKKTRMSINTIKDNFFYDEEFPKHKVGGKWYFPAEETKEFLLMWLREQSR